MDTYQIEKTLIHKLILSIIGGIFLIGGYMIAWAYLDAEWKGGMDQKIIEIGKYMSKLDSHIKEPCHKVACERLRNLKGD